MFLTALPTAFVAMLIGLFLNSDGNVDTSRMEQLFFQMSDSELEAVSAALHQEQVRRLAEARAAARSDGQGSRPKEDAKQPMVKNAAVAGVGSVNRSNAGNSGTLPPPPANEAPYVYVTEYGACFHMHRTCVHLARSKTVTCVPVPSHRRPCKTCSGRLVSLPAHDDST